VPQVRAASLGRGRPPRVTLSATHPPPSACPVLWRIPSGASHLAPRDRQPSRWVRFGNLQGRRRHPRQVRGHRRPRPRRHGRGPRRPPPQARQASRPQAPSPGASDEDVRQMADLLAPWTSPGARTISHYLKGPVWCSSGLHHLPIGTHGVAVRSVQRERPCFVRVGERGFDHECLPHGGVAGRRKA
jgi:hypothetical protein